MGKSKFEKICACCGKKYRYCDSCGNFRRLPRWMNAYCCENCHTIFNAMMSYNAKVKTIEEVAEILKQCDLSNKDSFDPIIQEFINVVFDIKVEKSVAEESTDKNPVAEEPKTETIPEPEVTVREKSDEVTSDETTDDGKKDNDEPKVKSHKKYYNGYKKK